MVARLSLRHDVMVARRPPALLCEARRHGGTRLLLQQLWVVGSLRQLLVVLLQSRWRRRGGHFTGVWGRRQGADASAVGRVVLRQRRPSIGASAVVMLVSVAEYAAGGPRSGRKPSPDSFW
jgi:hypothetical protein